MAALTPASVFVRQLASELSRPSPPSPPPLNTPDVAKSLAKFDSPSFKDLVAVLNVQAFNRPLLAWVLDAHGCDFTADLARYSRDELQKKFGLSATHAYRTRTLLHPSEARPLLDEAFLKASGIADAVDRANYLSILDRSNIITTSDAEGVVSSSFLAKAGFKEVHSQKIVDALTALRTKSAQEAVAAATAHDVEAAQQQGTAATAQEGQTMAAQNVPSHTETAQSQNQSSPLDHVGTQLPAQAVAAPTAAVAAPQSVGASAPPSFFCSITLALMRDPVFAADGHSYERSAIAEWLRSSNSSPKTGTQLSSKELVPNHALRNAIEEWEAANLMLISRASLELSEPPISSGSFKTVYKAKMSVPGAPQPMTVAVLKIRAGTCEAEAKMLLKLGRHPRLVKFFGQCLDNDEQMLVTEFVPRGSLSDALEEVRLTHIMRSLTYSDCCMSTVVATAQGSATLLSNSLSA
jgi:hypothetical protein